MKRMSLCLLTSLLLSAGCQTLQRKQVILFPGLIHTQPSQREAAALFAELGGEAAFLDLARYLYRWYLDENDYERFDPSRKGDLLIRRVTKIADAGDNSRYLEVVFPALGVTVDLKKADYRIAELKLHVKSGGYRITGVSRDAGSRETEAGDYARLDIDLDALYGRLFQTRLERQYPGDALLGQVQPHIVQLCDQLDETQRGKAKTFCFAPVQDIDNELWVFWEEGRRLFKYSSDIDLDTPDVFGADRFDVTVIDPVAQTVVSFEERPGDSRFVTRDQIARALFNCVILGKTSTVPPLR